MAGKHESDAAVDKQALINLKSGIGNQVGQSAVSFAGQGAVGGAYAQYSQATSNPAQTNESDKPNG